MGTTGRSVPWLLEQKAAQRGNHPFLIWEPFDGQPLRWTYSEFHDRVLHIAAGLRERGTRPGDKVLLHLENCPEFLLTWFACAQIGAVAVCTNTKSTLDEMRYFASHSQAVAGVTQPKFARLVADSLPDARWVAVTSTDAGATPGPGSVPGRNESFERLTGPTEQGRAVPLNALDPAWIQYTSGTTSLPKAVVLTHANALWGGKINATHEALLSQDVHLVHLPLCHINALSYSTLATMWAGATMVLVPRFSASRFWEPAIRNKCTWAGMIPFAVRALANGEIPPDHHFRCWGVGWSAPPDDQLFGLRSLGWYGMTETISHPIMDEPENPGRPGAMGRPTPEYQIAVVHEDGSPAGPEETGALLVRGVPGVSLFAGYLHDDDATADAVDPDGWLHTGDLVTVHADGFLSFSDRGKDMLKVGGENVAASEVERVIMGVAGVSEVAVVAGRHPMLDEVPVAFVIASEEHPALADEVMEACKQQLASFKVPTEVRVVAEMPRSTLNKIAKNELRLLLRGEQA